MKTLLQTGLFFGFVFLASGNVWAQSAAEVAEKYTKEASKNERAMELLQKSKKDNWEDLMKTQALIQELEGVEEEEEDKPKVEYRYKKRTGIIDESEMPQRVFHNVQDVPIP